MSCDRDARQFDVIPLGFRVHRFRIAQLIDKNGLGYHPGCWFAEASGEYRYFDIEVLASVI